MQTFAITHLYILRLMAMPFCFLVYVAFGFVVDGVLANASVLHVWVLVKREIAGPRALKAQGFWRQFPKLKQRGSE